MPSIVLLDFHLYFLSSETHNSAINLIAGDYKTDIRASDQLERSLSPGLTKYILHSIFICRESLTQLFISNMLVILRLVRDENGVPVKIIKQASGTKLLPLISGLILEKWEPNKSCDRSSCA